MLINICSSFLYLNLTPLGRVFLEILSYIVCRNYTCTPNSRAFRADVPGDSEENHKIIMRLLMGGCVEHSRKIVVHLPGPIGSACWLPSIIKRMTSKSFELHSLKCLSDPIIEEKRMDFNFIMSP